MAITNGQTTIGTAATPIDGRWHNPSRITIHNLDNTDAVYLGNSTVGTATGLELMKQSTLQFDLEPLDVIYAVSGKEGHKIRWLRQAV